MISICLILKETVKTIFQSHYTIFHFQLQGKRDPTILHLSQYLICQSFKILVFLMVSYCSFNLQLPDY